MAEKISYPNKEQRDFFKATEANEIKSVVNANAEELNSLTERVSETESEIVSNIISTIGITYADLDAGKSSYTNPQLAGKQVILIGNQTNTFSPLQFDADGFLDLGFTATSGFVGVLLGSLGTAPNADSLIEFLRTAFERTSLAQFIIADEQGYIGMKFDQNGLKTFNVTSSEFNLDNNFTLSPSEDNIFALVDDQGYIAMRLSTDGILHLKGIETTEGAQNSKLKNLIFSAETDSFGVAPREADGITADNIWWAKLRDKTGAKIGFINAVGGTCVAEKAGVDYGILDSRVNSLSGAYLPAQINIIYLAMMTNDFGGQNIQLGNINSTDQTTFYGALKVWYTKMKARYVNAKIFHIISTPRNRLGVEGVPAVNATTGFSFNDFRIAILRVAPLYDVHTIDMSILSMINTDNMGYLSGSTYIKGTTSDGLHMLAPAHDDYANQVIYQTELYL